MGSVTSAESMFGNPVEYYITMLEAMAGVPASEWDNSVAESVMGPGATVDDLFAYLSSIVGAEVTQANYTDFMNIEMGLSTVNYDATLTGWSSQSLQSGVTFGAGDSNYCNSETQRQNIITNYSWTINDSGKDCGSIGSTEFITTWKTDNPGTSGNNQIIIPTYPGETYDYNVDWGGLHH